MQQLFHSFPKCPSKSVMSLIYSRLLRETSQSWIFLETLCNATRPLPARNFFLRGINWFLKGLIAQFIFLFEISSFSKMSCYLLYFTKEEIIHAVVISSSIVTDKWIITSLVSLDSNSWSLHMKIEFSLPGFTSTISYNSAESVQALELSNLRAIITLSDLSFSRTCLMHNYKEALLDN